MFHHHHHHDMKDYEYKGRCSHIKHHWLKKCCCKSHPNWDGCVEKKTGMVEVKTSGGGTEVKEGGGKAMVTKSGSEGVKEGGGKAMVTKSGSEGMEMSKKESWDCKGKMGCFSDSTIVGVKAPDAKVGVVVPRGAAGAKVAVDTPKSDIVIAVPTLKTAPTTIVDIKP
jgi:hypothetical protein